MLRERATAVRADPEVVVVRAAAGVDDLATPTPGPGETWRDVAGDPADLAEAAAAVDRGYGSVRLHPLAVEHLTGAR